MPTAVFWKKWLLSLSFREHWDLFGLKKLKDCEYRTKRTISPSHENVIGTIIVYWRNKQQKQPNTFAGKTKSNKKETLCHQYFRIIQTKFRQSAIITQKTSYE